MSFERRPALTHEILTQLGLIILFVDGKVRDKKSTMEENIHRAKVLESFCESFARLGAFCENFGKFWKVFRAQKNSFPIC